MFRILFFRNINNNGKLDIKTFTCLIFFMFLKNHSLGDIAGQWRTCSEQINHLLSCVVYLAATTYINIYEMQTLEMMVLEKDARVTAPFEVYENRY